MQLLSLSRRYIALLLLVAVTIATVGLGQITPARSQDSTQQLVESEDALVQRTGNWSAQASASASGGSYLYSNGSEADALSLKFEGQRIEIVYVSGAALGTLAIEVDGTVVRTVITTDSETRYDERAVVNYLSDEPHTLKVYAQEGGVVAVDAFVVEVPIASTPSEIAPVSIRGPISDPFIADSADIIDAEEAWAMGYDGTGQVVVIIDDGFDLTDPALAGRVIHEACFFANPSATSRCPQGLPTDTTPGSSSATCGTVIAGNLNTCRHGTHNAKIVAGIAPGASLITIAMSAYGSDIFAALQYVDSIRTIYPNIVSLNLSFGGGFNTSSTICDDIDESMTFAYRDLALANIAPILPSGNGDSRFYGGNPAQLGVGQHNYIDGIAYSACISHVVSVGATDKFDQVAVYSQNAVLLNLLAPGSDISSPIKGDDFNPSGTSHASPMVAGAWALLRDAVPSASVSQVLDALQATGVPIYDARSGWTHARIDVDDAITALLTAHGLPTAPSSPALSGPTIHSLNLAWQDNSNNESGFQIYRYDGSDYISFAHVEENTTSLTLGQLACGTTHQFVVRAFNEAGETSSSPVSASTNTCPGATNDAFGSAQTINTLPFNYSQNVNSATVTGNDPTQCLAVPLESPASRTHTVWYSYTPTTNTRITVDLKGSTYDTMIAVITGSDTTPGFVVCNNNYIGTASQLWFDAFIGTTYRFMISNYGEVTLPTPAQLVIRVTGEEISSSVDTLSVFSSRIPFFSEATFYPFARHFYVSNIEIPTNRGAYRENSYSSTITNAQWVMGDWNGDGQKTPGYYLDGAFRYTNSMGSNPTFTGIWFGLNGQPIIGRFGSGSNDCIGVTDSGIHTNGDALFSLYFTCNLTSGPNPTLTYQWLSTPLPNSQGHSGSHQFEAGDFNGDGLDSVAVRRGPYIAYTNIEPTELVPGQTYSAAAFDQAQYFGAPNSNDYGYFVTGDWDNNNLDSFALFYQNGYFYRRNDLLWNSGIYILQRTGQTGTSLQAASWRLQ